MKVLIRADSVEIDGYVNAVERRSKPLRSRIGQFMERICKGAFKKAIERNDNIRLLLNHDWNRDLGGTKDGTLELTEDNIGLHARAKITDKEVVKKARNGDLVGWSFGFKDRDVDQHEENGIPTRDVKDMDLFEVSILDRTRTPAYDGTLVSVRSEDDIQYRGEPLITDVELREEQEEPEKQPEQREEKVIDYSKYEKMIKEMKGD
jgi:HK97 family phage prohead protease